jgi:predicted permease
MAAIREWLLRFWATFKRGRPDTDMEEELRAHVALAAEHGRHEPHASHVVTQAMDALRDQRGLPWLDRLVQDTRYAMRGLRRSPLFATVAIASLALGIGASTALFSLVDDLLLRSLPVRDPEHLIQVTQPIGMGVMSKPMLSFAPEMFEQVRATGLMSDVLGQIPLERPLVVIDGVPETTTAVEEISENYFRDLGVSLPLGRSPQASDGPAAVLSHGLWTRRFANDRAVLGRTIAVGNTSYTVVGVAPPRFMGISIDAPASLWIASGRPVRLGMIAHVRPDVSIAHATAALQSLFREAAREEGRISPEIVRAELLPAGRGISPLRSQYERPLQAVTILVALVLLLTCSNVGSLLMVRNASRRHELTIRVALGATRSRLLLQHMVEAVLLAIISGALAVAVARWGVSVFLSMLPLPTPPVTLAFDTDARVLAFVAVASLASALLFGVAPAWRASRVQLSGDLRASQGSSSSKTTRRLGRVLVACQVALSVLLLVGAGLFVQTLRNLWKVDVGFEPNSLLQVSIDTRGAGYREGQVGGVTRALLERVGAIPGVQSVSYVRNSVMRNASTHMAARMPGLNIDPDTDVWESAEVGPAFFETMGMPILRGRTFSTADFTEERPVYVANEAFVRRFSPGRDPVGIGGIIGIVPDARIVGVRGTEGPRLFQHARKEPDRINSLLVRTTGDSPATVAAIRDVVRGINPRLFLEIRTLRQEMERDLAKERMVAATSALFSLLGLLLAMIGIFGVASSTVAQRTNELGIRMALGAGRGRVVVESLRETMLMFAAGLAVGIVAAIIAVRLAASMMSELLFGLTATDTATIALAGLAMVAVAAAACMLPARHATRIDPLLAIRHE